MSLQSCYLSGFGAQLNTSPLSVSVEVLNKRNHNAEYTKQKPTKEKG